MQNSLILQLCCLLAVGQAAPQFWNPIVFNHFNPFAPLSGFPWTNPFNFFPFNNYNNNIQESAVTTPKPAANPVYYPFGNGFPFINPATTTVDDDVQELIDSVYEPVEVDQEPAEGLDDPAEVGFVSGTSCSLSCVSGVCHNICKVCTDGVCKVTKEHVNNDSGHYNFVSSNGGGLHISSGGTGAFSSTGAGSAGTGAFSSAGAGSGGTGAFSSAGSGGTGAFSSAGSGGTGVFSSGGSGIGGFSSGGAGGFSSGGGNTQGCSLSCVNGSCQNICQVCTNGVCKTTYSKK